MIRATLMVVFAFSAVLGVFFAIEHNKDVGLFTYATPAAVGTASLPAAPSPMAALDATGTVTYYPNNMGVRIPYLVYKDSRNRTETRVLAFGNTSTCITPAGKYPCALISNALDTYYAGQVIHVRGVTEAERVIVDTLSTAG